MKNTFSTIFNATKGFVCAHKIAAVVTVAAIGVGAVATGIGLAAHNSDKTNDNTKPFDPTESIVETADATIDTSIDTLLTTGFEESSDEPETEESEIITTATESETDPETESVASETETESEPVETEPEYIGVTGISVDKWEVTITETETTTITATIAPGDANNKAVTWASNNTGIATVDENGNIYGVATGECCVTATSADNSEVVAWIKVVVMPPYALPEDQVPEDIAEAESNAPTYETAPNFVDPFADNVTPEIQKAIAQLMADCPFCHEEASIYHYTPFESSACPYCGAFVESMSCHDCGK